MKVKEMPIRQEKQLSSEFHMAMLRELEEHHDEKSVDWSMIDPYLMIDDARERIAGFLYDVLIDSPPADPKQLVHAANELAIAWAILESKVAK